MTFLNKKTIFWDFDGVIKDSVGVKADAFEKLFLPFGEGVARKVRKHHEENGGVSRVDKLPIYLKWSGEELTDDKIHEYEKKFSLLVKQKVIDSAWIKGVLEFLKKNHNKKKFFIITATPQKEIEFIVDQLRISHYFKKIVGSPTRKSEAIKMILQSYSIPYEESMVIGDSISDYQAAVENKIYFLLRKTNLNLKLQKELNCPQISDFHNE